MSNLQPVYVIGSGLAGTEVAGLAWKRKALPHLRTSTERASNF